MHRGSHWWPRRPPRRRRWRRRTRRRPRPCGARGRRDRGAALPRRPSPRRSGRPRESRPRGSTTVFEGDIRTRRGARSWTPCRSPPPAPHAGSCTPASISAARVPMLSVMNATAQASAASISGPKLDNRRVLAALVDLGIVLAGTLVILFAADALSDAGEIRGALGAVIVGWALYYHFAMESGDGQTVGKRLMKLRVVRVDGRPAEMREIATRTVLRVVDG